MKFWLSAIHEIYVTRNRCLHVFIIRGILRALLKPRPSGLPIHLRPNDIVLNPRPLDQGAYGDRKKARTAVNSPLEVMAEFDR